jgi:glycogen debranching enzyme
MSINLLVLAAVVPFSVARATPVSHYALDVKEPNAELLLTDGQITRFFQTADSLPQRKYHGLTANGFLGFAGFSYAFAPQVPERLPSPDTGRPDFETLEWKGTTIQPGAWVRTFGTGQGQLLLTETTRLLSNGILLVSLDTQAAQLDDHQIGRLQSYGTLRVVPSVQMRSHHNAASPEFPQFPDSAAQLRRCTVSSGRPQLRVQSPSIGGLDPSEDKQTFILGGRDSGDSATAGCKEFDSIRLALQFPRDKDRYGNGDGNGNVTLSHAIEFELKTAQAKTWLAAALSSSLMLTGVPRNVESETAQLLDRVLDAPDSFVQQDSARFEKRDVWNLGSGNSRSLSSPSTARFRLGSDKMDSRFVKSLAWATYASRQMYMNFKGQGLVAGIPWFEQYWGRDTSISLEGALLIPGAFEESAQVLETMLTFMQTNPSLPDYGRIPNRLEPGSVQYNTADGLALFLLAFASYLDNTGDTLFLKKHFPKIKIAIEAELARTDNLGLFPHGDQETWMDGKLGDAVCSPRGNRAFEIQGLWFFALKRWAQLGSIVQGEREGDFKDRINARADRLRQAIRDSYLKFENGDGSGSRAQLADHLRADGTLDFTARPNALLVFQLDTQDLLLAAQEKEDLIADLVQKNIFTDFGVRSMGLNERFFNPYHAATGFCSAYACNGWISFHPYHNFGTHADGDHMDWAYHNGTVWQWLSGPAIVSLSQVKSEFRAVTQSIADRLFEALVHDLLEGQSPGHLAEIKDGVAAGSSTGHDKGTPMQTWSVAEFARVAVRQQMGYERNLMQDKVRFVPSTLFLDEALEIRDSLFVPGNPASRDREFRVKAAQRSFLIEVPRGILMDLELKPERLSGFSRFQVNDGPVQELTQASLVFGAGSLRLTLF